MDVIEKQFFARDAVRRIPSQCPFGVCEQNTLPLFLLCQMANDFIDPRIRGPERNPDPEPAQIAGALRPAFHLG